jgi:hypothetical protein
MLLRILAVAASAEGFGDADANKRRNQLLIEAIGTRDGQRASVVVVPAGYWTARRQDDVSGLMGRVARAVGSALRPDKWLVGGVDVAHRTRSKSSGGKGRDGDDPWLWAVKREALPFWGFAVSPDGSVHGPWRQLSTRSSNGLLARETSVQNVSSRCVGVRDCGVMPLVCGEMHSAALRSELGGIRPALVVVSGHSGLGQGLVGSLDAVHRESSAPVLHVQHLAPRTRGRIHWVTANGLLDASPRVAADGVIGQFGGDWVFPCLVRI